MPLPAPNSEWPPPSLGRSTDDREKWAAWWAGDPEDLTRVYQGTTSEEHGFARRAGLVGAVQRFFWGQQSTPGQQRTKLHLPVAAEIAMVSADLLFGAPPAITVPTAPPEEEPELEPEPEPEVDPADPFGGAFPGAKPEESIKPAISPEHAATQEAYDRLMGEDVHVALYDAAESCAALGDVALRVSFDKDVSPDAPILSAVDADAMFPKFRFGRLSEITFLSEWCENGIWWRHLQHHSCEKGHGLVEHALYQGTLTNLGRLMPLTDHPATAPMADSVVQLEDGRQGVETGLTRLDVVFVPNARSRTWRRLPDAKDRGRADISGLEQDLDAFDDVWSSWMRDLRHGRSRLHLPQQYLKSQGVGKGATADLDQELYVGLNTMVDASGQGGLQITQTQFAIRYAEHQATATALFERIVSGAGYSPQTFGLQDNAALTATESFSRQLRTQGTRAAKIRRWRIAVREVARLMVEMDRAQFGGNGDPEIVPDVVFQETVSESAKARAETSSLLFAAQAASTETLVRMNHPDWDDAQVMAEVEKIKNQAKEAAMVSPMAAAFGGDSEEGDPDALEDTDDPAGPGASPFGGAPAGGGAPGKPAGGKPAFGKAAA